MASNNTKPEKLEEEDRLVAVIIADTFNNNFYPATQDCPMALLSLINNPLIFYSFEWLRNNKVDDTIIYCNQKDAEAIRKYCKKWETTFGNRMKLIVVSSDSCSSVGDAMRDLYSKSLLKKDFILLDGFVVGNANLRKAVHAHKMSVKTDPTCIMTCLYRKSNGPPGIKFRSLDNTRIVHLVLNGKTSKILVYDRPKHSSKLIIPTRLLPENPRLLLRSVEDPHVSICSERVPMLFSDNFDYGTRDSLIQGVIEQEELLNYSIRSYIPEKGHMQLVSSFRAYEELSKLLVRRWFSPLVPERSLSTQKIRYIYDPWHSCYYNESAKVHLNVIGDYNVIDAGTNIDQRCKMKNSVVGKHCVIMGNVTINDSFLMDNVTIETGCILDNCFIGTNVKLLPGVHLEPGVILGPNTVLGPNLKVDRCKRLVGNPPESDSVEVSPLIYGKGAFEVIEDDNEVDENFEEFLKWGLQDLKWGEDPPVVQNLLNDSDSTNIEVDVDLDEDYSSDEEREQEFEREVMDSLVNAYRDQPRLSSVNLELNSSRHAYNVSWENVLRVVMKTVLLVVEKSDGEESLRGERLLQCVQKGLTYFKDVISKYVTTSEHQVIVLNLLESLINEEERFLPLITRIVYDLYEDIEILDADVLISWYNGGGHKTEKFPLIAQRLKKIVEWLEKDDDEEEDDENNNDDEDDDDDEE